MLSHHHNPTQRRKDHQDELSHFLKSMGAVARRWPIATDRAIVADELYSWLCARMARPIAPDGIDLCSIFVRVSKHGKGIVRPYSCEGFSQSDSAGAIDAVVTAVTNLAPEDYPDATHLEVHLISLSEATRYQMSCPR